MTKQKENYKQDEFNDNFESKIVNSDNLNIFETLICKTNKLKLLYRITKYSRNKRHISK